MTNYGFISRRQRAITAWVLIAGILLQPILTFLASPWFTEDGQGHLTVICTLEGLKEVYVDDSSPLTQQTDDEYCPALELIQLVGSAHQVAPPVIAPLALYFVGLVDQTYDQEHHSLHYSAYSTRAPPIA